MNIPTSLIVVLLVVAWLVVLVPMVARRRERVPQVEPAGSGFRVLRRASASLRRRPSRGSKGRMMSTSDHSGDGAPDNVDRDIDQDVDQQDELVAVGAEQPADAAEEWAAAQRVQRPRPVLAGSTPMRAPSAREVDTEDLIDEEDVGDDAPADEDPETVRLEARGHGDGHVEPERTMIPDEIDREEWDDHAAAAPAGAPYEVDDVQLRPVPRRPGRGGFDPEAAEVTRAYRYQQRRRVALVLLIATAAFTVAALLLISWLWVGSRGQRGVAGRLPRLPAASGQDRGVHPAAPDGTTAAGTADPAGVPAAAAADPRRAVRGRSGTNRGRPRRRRSRLRRAGALQRADDVPAGRGSVTQRRITRNDVIRP